MGAIESMVVEVEKRRLMKNGDASLLSLSNGCFHELVHCAAESVIRLRKE
jgi:hypothetical protein